MNEFWGIEFQDYSKKETFQVIDQRLNRNNFNKKFFIVTLNPELLLFANKDVEYQKILNSADLKNVDGVGIKLMGWFKKKNFQNESLE